VLNFRPKSRKRKSPDHQDGTSEKKVNGGAEVTFSLTHFVLKISVFSVSRA